MFLLTNILMASDSNIKKKKILPLESLRGFAALSVCLLHFHVNSFLRQNAFIDNAELMVDFFFVLSGFVIALNYSDKIKVFSDLFVFQTRRFWRLYPLHFFTLLIFLGIEVFKYVVEINVGSLSRFPAFSNNDVSAFLHNLFLTHGLFLSRVTFNLPSWSISTEFYTYLIFAVTMLSSRFRFYFCLLISLSAFLILSLYDPLFQFREMRFLRCIYCFFLGVLAFWVVQGVKFNVPNYLPAFFLFLSILAVCVLGNTSVHALIPFVFALTIMCFSLSDGQDVTSRVLSMKWPVHLGTISYSIYMVHETVLFVFTQILRFGFHVPIYINSRNEATIGVEQTTASLLIIFAIIVIISVSHITYLFVENRFRKGFKKEKDVNDIKKWSFSNFWRKL